MPRISNREVKEYVNKREQFVTNNGTITSAISATGMYVVYSYGRHFPLYAYDEEKNQWYGNSDKYSQTTSCHQSHARPDGDIQWTDTETLRKLTESPDAFVMHHINERGRLAIIEQLRSVCKTNHFLWERWLDADMIDGDTSQSMLDAWEEELIRALDEGREDIEISDNLTRSGNPEWLYVGPSGIDIEVSLD
tara:strand:- start:40 stop:618 length:579 start_codon:yes stop_codon:yes gene_type:complete